MDVRCVRSEREISRNAPVTAAETELGITSLFSLAITYVALKSLAR